MEFSTSTQLASVSYSQRLARLAKRAMDLTIASLAVLLLGPLLGLVAVAIRRDSPGPVFYRGWRVGEGGRPFRILKFRTMYEVPESYDGPRVTARDDARITPLGHWLRDTKLNELPQFLNVIKGDMSLVGPRPEDPELAKMWSQPVREEVLSVRPGITSPASILYRNEETLLCAGNVLQRYFQELAPDKQRLDQLYVRYRSLCLDFDTLLWTALILLPRLRSFSPPEELLFVGPVTRLVRRHMNWFMIDLLVTMTAIVTAGLVWRGFGPLDLGWPKATVAALCFALLFSLSATLLGVHRIAWSKATSADVYDLLPAWAMASLVAFYAGWVADLLPRSLLLTASAMALAGFIVVRYRSRLISGLLSRIARRRARIESRCERVLIVGSDQVARQAAWLLGGPECSWRISVVGFVDDDLLAQGMRVYGAQVIGTIREIPKLVVEHHVDTLVLADRCVAGEHFQMLADICQSAATRLVVMPDLVGALSGAPGGSRIGGCAAARGEGAESMCRHCLAGCGRHRDTSGAGPVEGARAA
jgi:lipopolysaccharide/colanic/teichoic acid biosynthesis glycosyltransferase